MSEGLRKVIDIIPEDQREPVSTTLLDLLLKTKNTTAVPAREAKMVLHYMMHDRLATDGIETLFECALRAEPVKTLEVLGDIFGGIMAAEEVEKAYCLLAAQAKRY